MIDLALRVLAAYLMGSLNGALLIGRFRGIDIRTQGSGNAGGTNALRTQGWTFASGVILIDVLKAVLAVRWLPNALVPAQYPLEWLAVACGFAAVLGHVYPVFHGFRGGKGVATVLGTLLALSMPLLLGLLAIWLVMMFVFGFVGLGSMVAAASLPILVQLGAAR
ncbi:MAG: glycerol-3-phosphate acyltransferase, partial [Gammaproteobacteria bacterium]